jgi:hypothetical protein
MLAGRQWQPPHRAVVIIEVDPADPNVLVVLQPLLQVSCLVLDNKAQGDIASREGCVLCVQGKRCRTQASAVCLCGGVRVQGLQSYQMQLTFAALVPAAVSWRSEAASLPACAWSPAVARIPAVRLGCVLRPLAAAEMHQKPIRSHAVSARRLEQQLCMFLLQPDPAFALVRARHATDYVLELVRVS